MIRTLLCAITLIPSLCAMTPTELREELSVWFRAHELAPTNNVHSASVAALTDENDFIVEFLRPGNFPYHITVPRNQAPGTVAGLIPLNIDTIPGNVLPARVLSVVKRACGAYDGERHQIAKPIQNKYGTSAPASLGGAGKHLPVKKRKYEITLTEEERELPESAVEATPKKPRRLKEAKKHPKPKRTTSHVAGNAKVRKKHNKLSKAIPVVPDYVEDDLREISKEVCEINAEITKKFEEFYGIEKDADKALGGFLEDSIDDLGREEFISHTYSRYRNYVARDLGFIGFKALFNANFYNHSALIKRFITIFNTESKKQNKPAVTRSEEYALSQMVGLI